MKLLGPGLVLSTLLLIAPTLTAQEIDDVRDEQLQLQQEAQLSQQRIATLDDETIDTLAQAFADAPPGSSAMWGRVQGLAANPVVDNECH